MRPRGIYPIAMLLAMTTLCHPNRAGAGDYLLKTQWYQDGPFAQFTPNHERVGCWSTAYAQILHYHRLKPHGRVSYECANGAKVDVDLDGLRFDWTKFPDRVDAATPKAEAAEAARYSWATAAVVRKDFGTGGYKRLLNSVEDLESHFAVDAEIYVSLGGQPPLSPEELTKKLKAERITHVVDQAAMARVVQSEIEARRPVYFHFGNIKDFGHSTVIDGFRREGGRAMAHINFGSVKPEHSRWYDLSAPISQPDDVTLRAVVTINSSGGKQTEPKEVDQTEGLLRERLPLLLREHNVPAAAVAVVRNGELACAVVAGEQERGVPATLETLFNVASLTKPVAAHAILRLIDEGKLGLDEPLHPYWVDPDLREDDRKKLLTTRIILGHQTGFPNWRDGRPLSFHFTPGEGVGYSGEGFEFLRRAVEARTGRALSEMVAEKVFKPWGMTDTHFVWEQAFESRFAKEHDKEGRRIVVQPKSVPCAADDLLTTIGDYGRFAAAIARGASISSELFRQVCSPASVRGTARVGGGPDDYGLCWRILATEHGIALAHGGSDQGVRAGVLILPHSRDGVVIFTNGDNGGRIIAEVVPLVLAHGSEYLSRYIGPAAVK